VTGHSTRTWIVIPSVWLSRSYAPRSCIDESQLLQITNNRTLRPLQVDNARAKAAGRLDEIMTEEMQNAAVFQDLATSAAGAEAQKRQQIKMLHSDWAAQRLAQEEDRQLQDWSDRILTDTQTLMPEKTGVKADAAED
jgi:hypothetical protein